MTSQSQTEFQSQSQQIRAISLKLLSFRPSLGRAVFVAMETAESNTNQQMAYLSKAFP
jgi:hypothetical protein